MNDQRAGSLIGTLRTGYFLRAHSIELECVVDASRDPQVKAVIHEFCHLTKFRQSEVELALDSLMPTYRKRWWCLLTNATLPSLSLKPLPRLPRQVVFGDVIPVCPNWPHEHLKQLALDQYESGKFQACGGLEQNMVKHDGVLKTALHGCANQLSGCPCKCRRYPLSEERLQSKGMFGALIRIEGVFKTSQGDLPCTRHMHPWEMCVVHGGIPCHDWEPLRFSIAALGQMASPVQSCWITGQLMSSFDQARDIQPTCPEVHLWNHFTQVFQAVARDQPSVYSAPAFQRYIDGIRSTLQGQAMISWGPSYVSPPDRTSRDEENSQRSGRKDPQTLVPLMPLLQCLGGNKQPAVETQALPPPMTVQAMPMSALVTVGPSPHSPMMKAPTDVEGGRPEAMETHETNQGVADLNADSLRDHATLKRPVERDDFSEAPPKKWKDADGSPNTSIGRGDAGTLPTRAEATCLASAKPHHAMPVTATDNGEFPLKGNLPGKQCVHHAFASLPEPAPVSHPKASESHSHASLAGLAPQNESRDEENSQRSGRKNPQIGVPTNFLGKESQIDKQPAVETPELPLPMSFQAMPRDAFVTRGPSPHGPMCESSDLVKMSKPCHAEETSSNPASGMPNTLDQHQFADTNPKPHEESTGGLVAFASGSNPSKSETHSPIIAAEAREATKVVAHQTASDEKHASDPAEANDEGDSLTQGMLQVAQEIASSEILKRKHIESHTIQVIRQDDNQPSFIKIDKQATVGSVTVVEANIGSLVQPICVNTCVGTRYPTAAITKPFDQIFLKEMAQYGSGTSDEAINMPPELLANASTTRIALLYRQEAFVAQDEMEFYLNMITATGQASVAPAAIIPHECDDEELIQTLQNWYAQALLVHDAPSVIVTAIFAHHHWFPVGIRFAHGKVDMFTTPGGHDWLKVITQDMPNTCNIITVESASKFNNDCGFQCVGWIMSFVFDATHTHDRAKPVTPETAAAWRGLFEHHLHVTGKAKAVSIPSQIAFGGVTGGDVTQGLCQLLHEHGVAHDVVQERAQTVLDKLGRSAVMRALRGTQPWKEIKQLSNQCSPKLQLVLPSELQEVIRNRTNSQQKFGSKKDKKKHAPQAQKPIHIDAEDISIPDGIFQDADGKTIQQRPINSIGPEARGIVVVKAMQAVPYLRFQKPVSQNGLALLVIDHQDPLLHGVGEEVRFPARYEKTSEPILMSAKLVQIGASIVSRTVPAHATKVDEVMTAVVRVAVYRDECDVKWESIVARPVKHLISSVQLLQPNGDMSPIMDVWDRQFLNEKLERTKPSDATIFMACFRLEASDITEALKTSGDSGCYLEPRSHDGRSPSTDYRVIWINKQDKQNVMIASQATKQWTCIVRSGNRFGLRTRVQDAQAVHETHKPQVPFLTSDQVMTFHVGPMPHGSNRTALTKLFQSWSWQARPCQPRNRTPDGKGVVWECQAICKPPYEVYQLDHADVLITEVPKKAARNALPQGSIQASAKTMAALKAADSQSQENADPWEANDPWGNYTTPTKGPRPSTQQTVVKRNDDIEAIAAKVQQKLQPAWSKHINYPKNDTDQDMNGDETRIQVVEDRLAKLEQTVQANQLQQGKHVQELASQIAQVQKNVDQQGRAFHAHLDEKLDNQLHQIEQLLAKRSRTE